MKLHLAILPAASLILLIAALIPIAGNAGSKWHVIVTGVKGQWTFVGRELPADRNPPRERSAPLRFGDSFNLGEGACLAGIGESLVLQIEDQPYSFSCKGERDRACENVPVDGEFNCLRQVAPSGTPSGSLLAAIWPFRPVLSRFISPVSRGLEPELKDGVVSLQDGEINLRPILENLDPGNIRLQFSKADGSRTDALVELRWAGSDNATASARGLRPGLYRVVLLADDKPSGTNAWVLVSGPERFSKDAAAFQAAFDQTKKWPEDVDSRAERMFLGAYLESLSKTEAR